MMPASVSHVSAYGGPQRGLPQAETVVTLASIIIATYSLTEAAEGRVEHQKLNQTAPYTVL